MSSPTAGNDKSRQRVQAVVLDAGDAYGRWVVNWMFPCYLGMIAVGFWAIWWSGFPAGNRSAVRALFCAMNGATLTGFDQSPGLSGLNFFGQFVILIMMIVGTLFSLIAGSLAVTRIVRLPFTDDQVIYAAVGAQCLALLVGTGLLMIGDRTLFQAVFLAAAAFGNCGLSVGNLPNASSIATHAIVLPMTILGGLGLPVLMELIRAIRRRQRLSDHTRTVLVTSAWLYVVGFGLLFLLSVNLHTLKWRWAADTAKADSVVSIESRTGGLPIVPIHGIGQSAQWIVIILMAIGASPAGTGGGLKTTTLAQLIRGTRRLLAGEQVSRSFGFAVAWLGIYAALVLGSAILLSHISRASNPDGALLNAVSGLSNVGFTLTQLPDMRSLLYGYCAIMLVGRVAPVMVLWWMADNTTEADVAIG
ncbi:MAG: potassium transporter TrkG [Tepidisphaeraceae bacterium]